MRGVKQTSWPLLCWPPKQCKRGSKEFYKVLQKQRLCCRCSCYHLQCCLWRSFIISGPICMKWGRNSECLLKGLPFERPYVAAKSFWKHMQKGVLPLQEVFFGHLKKWNLEIIRKWNKFLFSPVSSLLPPHTSGEIRGTSFTAVLSCQPLAERVGCIWALEKLASATSCTLLIMTLKEQLREDILTAPELNLLFANIQITSCVYGLMPRTYR